jgi:hypothetical protein
MAMVMHILGDAAQGVPAHFGTASVRIVHDHFRIESFCRTDDHKAIGANAEMAVADLGGQCWLVLWFRLVETIDIHIIVAGAVHLGKPHGDSL